jgi:NADPH2:quinone reductase
MRAIQAAKRGGYDALHVVDIPPPRPEAGQALVRVTSAGVTPLDHTVLAGLHPRATAAPLVPGNEGAGVVIQDPSGRFAVSIIRLLMSRPNGRGPFRAASRAMQPEAATARLNGHACTGPAPGCARP